MPDLACAPIGSELLSTSARRFSSVQRAALRALIAAIEDGTGCAAVTGEAGTGKTAVLDAAAALLSHPPVQVIRIAGGGAPLSSRRLIAQIMGAEAGDEAADGIEQVLERLLAPAPPWTRTVLVVDDAHMLERDALAYLQLTCGLHASDVAGLQILFAGRPEFWSLLESDQLRSLRERIRLRPVLRRAPALRLVAPSRVEIDSAAALPSTTASAMPPHDAPREAPVPPKRRSRMRYAMASGVAATVVIASIGPLTRDPPASELPIITAGYAAPARTAADARSDTLLQRVAAKPLAPAFTHAISASPVVAVQIAATAPEANAPGGPPSAATPAPTATAGTSPAPQPDAIASAPAASTPAPTATAGTPPAPQPDATAGAPAATAPAPTTTAGAPPAPQPDATGTPPAAATPAPTATAAAPPGGAADWQGAGTSPAATPALRATGETSPPPPGGKRAGLMPPSRPSAAAPSAAPVPQPTAALPPAMVASLLRHGQEMLRIGDIAAARLLFRRAAEAGSAAAAIALGKTNDPRFLAETGAQGIVPDPAAAADWYRRAAALGDRDADHLLDGLRTSAAR